MQKTLGRRASRVNGHSEVFMGQCLGNLHGGQGREKIGAFKFAYWQGSGGEGGKGTKEGNEEKFRPERLYCFKNSKLRMRC